MPQTGKIRRVQQLYARGEITCEELTRRYLDSIERDNGTLNAYVTVTPDTALEAARRVDAKLRAGETLRPLEGIPMTLKDNISTRGIPTTCCSRILEGYTPIYDATVWELLQRENAVLLSIATLCCIPGVCTSAQAKLSACPPVRAALFIGVLLLCIAALVAEDYNPFLYFRF